MRCRNDWCDSAPELAAYFGHSASGHLQTGALVRAGVRTKAQVDAMSDAALLSIRGVGVGAVRRLRRPAPGPHPETRRTLPVTGTRLRFPDEDGPGDFFAVVEVQPSAGQDQQMRVHGRFFNGHAAAVWAARNLPAGHHWAVVPVNTPPRRPFGND